MSRAFAHARVAWVAVSRSGKAALHLRFGKRPQWLAPGRIAPARLSILSAQRRTRRGELSPLRWLSRRSFPKADAKRALVAAACSLNANARTKATAQPPPD